MLLLSKKKALTIFVTILVILILVPVGFLALFAKNGGDSVHYFDSYKELWEELQKGDVELKDGDVVVLTDVLSGIWYEEDTKYTYLLFESMDAERDAFPGYDAGYRGNAAEDYNPGDRIRLKINIVQQLNEQGVPTILGRIESISLA